MSSNLVKSFSVGGYKYDLIYKRCNKGNCNKCPHGPYWYMKITLRTGKQVQRYVGKSLPEGIHEP